MDIKNFSKIDLNLLKLLTEHLPDMLWIKDLEGKYIYVNKAICDGLLMAKDTQEPIGKGDVFFALREREAHKENPKWHTFGELCFNSDQVVIDNNEPMKFEEWGNVKGKLLYLEVNKAPFYDDSGKIIGTVGSGRDITQLKLTQLKLAKQAQIIEQIHDSIITTSLDGEILTFNKSAQKLFGYEKSEIIGTNIDKLFSHDDFEQIKHISLNHLENKYFESTFNLLDKYFSKIVCEVSISSLEDEDGNKDRTIYYIKDITEKSNLSNEVKKQENIITSQAHHVAMGEMIGNIAHQWRQPLSVISTAATGMSIQKEAGILTDELFYDSCEMIDKNAQYLSKTIDDFRNFIKGDRVMKKFNLKDEIESFLNLVNSSIKSHNIELVLNLDRTIVINGYENELTQCFINLYNNSKDALNEHKPKKKYFFIESFIEDDLVTITIKDNAGGIPKDVISHIFEPYFTTKHQSQGTGLGLHMTYNFITSGMEGEISVENATFKQEQEQYTGACFTIKIPKSLE